MNSGANLGHFSEIIMVGLHFRFKVHISILFRFFYFVQKELTLRGDLRNFIFVRRTKCLKCTTLFNYSSLCSNVRHLGLIDSLRNLYV